MTQPSIAQKQKQVVKQPRPTHADPSRTTRS